MIPDHLPDWRAALRDAYRDPRELLSDLQIDPASIDWLPGDALSFPMRVPRGFAARMRTGDPHDPLLLQVLPRVRELHSPKGFVADPLQEARFQDAPGLIQKYTGRALLITTGACGVHCRYCFRREFPYSDAAQGQWQPALDTLSERPDIEEIILSGGDPLSLSDERLERLIGQLDAMPHLQRLRIHSRQPIVLPERVTGELCQMLSRSRLETVIVVHSNHANELDDSVARAIKALRETGATLLNQSVLLKGVNDNADTLADLSRRLFSLGVLPYYLHRLDPVIGASHFELADCDAHGIMQDLNAKLPGYMVPRLVREVAGASGKLPEAWAVAPDE